MNVKPSLLIRWGNLILNPACGRTTSPNGWLTGSFQVTEDRGFLV